MEFKNAGCSSGSKGIMEDTTAVDYEECRYPTELKPPLLVATINGWSTILEENSVINRMESH